MCLCFAFLAHLNAPSGFPKNRDLNISHCTYLRILVCVILVCAFEYKFVDFGGKY